MQQTESLYLHFYPLSESSIFPITQQLASVSHLPFSLLLDSAGIVQNDNQFSMMLWSPSIVVTHQQGRTVITDCETGSKSLSSVDPMIQLDRLMDGFAKKIILAPVSSSQYQYFANTLPFQCGMAGAIGYDINRFYHRFETHKVDYATPDLVVGFYTQALVHCHESGQQILCYLSSSATPDQNPLSRLSVQAGNTSDNKPQPFAMHSGWQSNMSQPDYTLALGQIHDYLVAGDCYQTNFSQQFTALYSGDEYQAYLALRDANNAPFSAFMRTQQGAILSVSPERFLSVHDGQVETKPIKGTRPRSPDPVTDVDAANALLSSEKDRAENLMIVDLLRNDLSKHCQPGTVEVPKLFSLESYEAVHHMVSTVQGQLASNSTPLQLLKDAFPGGSITGAPKVRAMEIIDELEPDKRSIYCGSIFYNGWRGDMDASICIRTVLAEHGKLYCNAGGGIVLDSDADAEYQETLDKVGKILPVLERFKQL